jgi:hypothetical protein
LRPGTLSLRSVDWGVILKYCPAGSALTIPRVRYTVAPHKI